MQETRIRSLGWEDPLEEEMATHSSILAWRIPRTEEPVQYMGSQRVGYDCMTNTRPNLKTLSYTHLELKRDFKSKTYKAFLCAFSTSST